MDAAEQKKKTLVAIVGPTASGKTGLAVELAGRVNGSIINVDSMQVYRGLDVGTDKPTPAQRSVVPFYGVDIAEPGAPFDAAEFARHADDAYERIRKAGRVPIVAGGTGLYHRALRFGLDPVPKRDEAVRNQLRARRDVEGIAALHAELKTRDPAVAERIHPNDWIRIERALEVLEITGASISEQHRGFDTPRYRTLVLGCFRPRAELYERINTRLAEMWTSGIFEEAQTLLELDDTTPAVRALGYRQALAALRGEITREDALREAQKATRRFAKRQLTWFRADDTVRWIQLPLASGVLDALAERILAFDASGAFDDAGFDWVGSV